MKLRSIIIAVAAALVSTVAFAVPANPVPFDYVQPDGSIVRIQLHGDEFFSWTTIAGTSQVVELDDKGFWRPATIDPAIRHTALERRRMVNQQRRSYSAGKRTHNDDPMTHGERHIPVILIQFKDIEFKISDPAQQFKNLLNQAGYSDNGGTGSVQDFYLDNSHGAFKPVFDVYGPVELDNDCAYYGAQVKDENGKVTSQDKQPELALFHACQKLDDSVDFSQYDYDNNGIVDMVLFYYAGYNQAEGQGTNVDTIWPHQWNLLYSSNSAARRNKFDGKSVGPYFCTSELKGRSGTWMCGIGTTCHEFGHSLGLPDFYDTNYEDDGECGALYEFSTMCGGSYNNNGCTPPYFNAEERIFLGWMTYDDIVELPDGSTVIAPVQNDIAYKSMTDIEGEYFIYECRDGSGWDAPLPTGMLVYHADKSTVRTVGGITPYEQWAYWGSYNTINAYGDHPCFYIVPAASQTDLNYKGRTSEIVFPGSKGVSSFVPIDWEGAATGITVSGISYSNGTVTLTASYSTEKGILGTVTGQDGKPIAGVSVVMTEPGASQAPRIRSIHRRNIQTITDETGGFFIPTGGIDADQIHLTLSKDGYKTKGVDVKITGRITSVTITMVKNGESEIQEYSYYDKDYEQIYLGGVESYGNSIMASIMIPASELPSGGGQVTAVTFCPYYNADAYYIIIDAGKERVLTYQIPGLTGNSNMVTVDLTSQNAYIPGGKDVYIGYAVKNAATQYTGYPFLVVRGSGHCYYSKFNLTTSNWNLKEDDWDLMLSTTIIGMEHPEDPTLTVFGKMGFNAIADPGNGSYAAGDGFVPQLELPQGVTPSSVSWTFDGTPITGEEPLTLTAGSHRVRAVLRFADQSTQMLELLLDVK